MHADAFMYTKTNCLSESLLVECEAQAEHEAQVGQPPSRREKREKGEMGEIANPSSLNGLSDFTVYHSCRNSCFAYMNGFDAHSISLGKQTAI
jgi:hypothetical protein